MAAKVLTYAIKRKQEKTAPAKLASQFPTEHRMQSDLRKVKVVLTESLSFGSKASPRMFGTMAEQHEMNSSWKQCAGAPVSGFQPAPVG